MPSTIRANKDLLFISWPLGEKPLTWGQCRLKTWLELWKGYLVFFYSVYQSCWENKCFRKSYYFQSILFLMTSSDLNINLTRKCLYTSCKLFNDLSNAVCLLSFRCVIFVIWEEGRKVPPSAQNRTFQNPPGIGLRLPECQNSVFIFMHFRSHLRSVTHNNLKI